MRGNRKYLAGIFVVAMGVAVVPLQAQRGLGVRGLGFQRPGAPNMGRSVELALERQGELGLTQEQVTQLQEVKAVMDGEVAGLVEQLNQLREDVRSGDTPWDEARPEMEALTGKLITASAPLRGRVQEILTVEQHRKLQPLVWEERPGLGRNRAVPGRGAMAFGGGRIGMGIAFGGGRVGRGMGRQPLGVPGGVGLRPGFFGQGRALAPGSRRAAPGAWFPRGFRSLPYTGRGPAGGPPVDFQQGGNLP